MLLLNACAKRSITGIPGKTDEEFVVDYYRCQEHAEALHGNRWQRPFLRCMKALGWLPEKPKAQNSDLEFGPPAGE